MLKGRSITWKFRFTKRNRVSERVDIWVKFLSSVGNFNNFILKSIISLTQNKSSMLWVLIAYLDATRTYFIHEAK